MTRRTAASVGMMLSLSLAWAWFPAQARDPTSAPLPPFIRAYQPEGVDERGMWLMADEEERSLRDSSFVIGAPDLNTYVRGIFCRTVGE